MESADWENPDARAITVELGSEALLLINGWWEPLDFTLPAAAAGTHWTVEIDTALENAPGDERVEGSRRLEGRSMALLAALT